MFRPFTADWGNVLVRCKNFSKFVEISSDLVEISSDLVEISSELVQFSSELVSTIAELLIISTFKISTITVSETTISPCKQHRSQSLCLGIVYQCVKAIPVRTSLQRSVPIRFVSQKSCLNYSRQNILPMRRI